MWLAFPARQANGRLGDGSYTRSNTPRVVVSADGTGVLMGVVSVRASETGTCALLDTTSLRCWGYNQSALAPETYELCAAEV